MSLVVRFLLRACAVNARPDAWRRGVNGIGLQGMMSDHRMDDAAYKRLFSRPGMVRDLLRGFAARDWSGALDFDSLTPLPASYVSRDLRQRHGDLVWRIRFGGERWLYLVLLLEFQSGVDRAMAVRMLTYSGLLYQKLVAEGVLRERGALPVVLYNGRSPWTAPADVAELVAAGGSALARYQPSQQYFLLDEGRVDGGSLPPGNLVSALIALETNRDQARLPTLLDTLIGLLRAQDDEELTDAFSAWAAQVLLPRRMRGTALAPLPRLEEVRTMLAETVREWTEQWVEQGIERGIEQGRAEERALLCRLAARKFDAAAGQQLATALAEVTDPGRLAQVGEWIIECGTAAELFSRLADTAPPAD